MHVTLEIGVSRTVSSSSHHSQPIPQAFLGNPSPTLAIWLCLPATS